MLNHEKELDVIALRLQDTANLLSAFLDFCNNEGKFDENVPDKEVVSTAWCFWISMQKQKALIESAHYIIEKQSEIVYSLFDEQEAGAKQ